MESVTLGESIPQTALSHLGLIAGEGQFPFLLARAARGQGIPVTAIGIRGVTAPELAGEVDTMLWIDFLQFNQLVKQCHAAGIHKAILAGRIQHSSIFQLAKIDLRGIRVLARAPSRRADAILGAVTDELAREQIEIIDSTLLLRDCMPQAGLLTTARPASPEVLEDIAFARPLVDAIAGMDIGQTLIVKQKAVVAVEAMEGTNAAILRAREVGGPGCTVVKVCKPQQDRRFDVPVVGLRTVEHLVQARCAALAFPGGKVLFFDQDEARALAERGGIAIYAW